MEMMFLWIAALLVCPLAMLLMMKGGMEHGGHAPHHLEGVSEPLEIARTRLAKGEITGEQYDVIRRTLTAGL